MASLYVDEDFPQPVVEFLREWGNDMLTAQEAGEANLGFHDDRVMYFARRTKRIALTHNRRDFSNHHRNHPDHYGIIVCTRDMDFEGLAGRIHAVLAMNPDLTGRLVRVIRPNPSQKSDRHKRLTERKSLCSI